MATKRAHGHKEPVVKTVLDGITTATGTATKRARRHNKQAIGMAINGNILPDVSTGATANLISKIQPLSPYHANCAISHSSNDDRAIVVRYLAAAVAVVVAAAAATVVAILFPTLSCNSQATNMNLVVFYGCRYQWWNGTQLGLRMFLPCT